METKKKDDVDLGKKGNRPSWKGKDAALVLLGPGLSNSPLPLRRCKVEIGDSDNDREYAPALACNLVRDAGSRNKKPERCAVCKTCVVSGWRLGRSLEFRGI